jgi:sugar phosphate isomerase/epimerase
MRLAYNTNGFPCHKLDDATRILADLGYDGIALTPDVHHLDPFSCSAGAVDAYAALLERLGLDVAVETGARFILEGSRKHHPTLLSPEGFERRQDFLRRCIDMAAALGASLVSTWSGALEGSMPPAEATPLLAERLGPVLEHAAARGITIALEPEPGMYVGNLARYDALQAELAGVDLRLTLDVGHAHITENVPVNRVIADRAGAIANVHLDDAAGGRHEHLPPGEGEIPFGPVMAALGRLDPAPFISVELSRHGHDAVEQARRTRAYLLNAGS